MQQLGLRMIFIALHAFLERGTSDHCLGAASVTHQYAVIAQSSEHFTGRRRKKFSDDPVFEHNPLRVCAGKTKQAAPMGQRSVEARGTQDLRFLPAHDIGSIQAVAAPQAWNNVKAAAAQRYASAQDLLRD